MDARPTGRHDCDAVILGAGLGGLVTGALLGARGLRVTLIDPAPGIGGGGGATCTPDGFWFDFGWRDGRDVGDCIFPTPEHCLTAAKEAGVELHLAKVKHAWRIHRLPGGPTLDRTAPNLDRIAREILGLAEPDRLHRLLADWAAAPPEEAEAQQQVPLSEWLPEHVPDPELRAAVLRHVALTWHAHPEQASAGRFMQASRLDPQLLTPDDPEVGGMQGLMEPWARAIRARGGHIVTDCRPVEILVEHGRAVGALGVDPHCQLLEVRAPRVVFTSAAWELAELVDSATLPASFVRDARALEAYKGDLVGWQAALSRLPRLRASGEPDAHDGWNRFLEGPECTYRGGYQIPSLTSRRAAPDGKHVLCMVMNRWLQGGSRTPQPWGEARRALDANLAYLREHVYSDLDDCIEWARHVYHPAPQAMTWWHGPGPRHGLEDAGIGGLLLASHTLEAPSSVGNVDMGAYAGRLAAQRALELAASA